MRATTPDDLDKFWGQLQERGLISPDLPPFNDRTKAAICKGVNAMSAMELRPEGRITLTRLLRGGARPEDDARSRGTR